MLRLLLQQGRQRLVASWTGNDLLQTYGRYSSAAASAQSSRAFSGASTSGAEVQAAATPDQAVRASDLLLPFRLLGFHIGIVIHLDLSDEKQASLPQQATWLSGARLACRAVGRA